MKKFLILVLTVLMVLSWVAVSTAAVTIGGLARFQWIDDSTINDSYKDDQIRVNFDSDVNEFVSSHAQLRVKRDNAPFLWDYYVALKPSFGTVKIGQWENDFFGDVDPLSQWKTDEFTDTLWYTQWAVQFAPKLGGGFSAAIWYNPADDHASYVSKGGNAVSVGKNAYTVSVAYAKDALALEAAVGDVGEISGEKYDSITLFNASYTVSAFKFFLHYGQTGKDNPWLSGTEQKNEIVGVKYRLPDTGFAAQAEYDLAPDEDNPAGLGLYYTANGVGYTYYYVTKGDDTYQQARIQINF
ncbi:MAG TPA: hypothetical protein DDW65_07315 [Firmicutes bacterium]|jgi:hypothetical protein|nr:hypothetical protein [Bacillota bacterium]